MPAYRHLLLGACAVVTVPATASAQRAAENALRSAEDAFGSSIGNESIGLYSPFGVRGFSPFAAGNVRLEGLYYDAAVAFNGRLIRGSTVRVGISAQGYPFPAPTGIADYRLRLPANDPALSAVAAGDNIGGSSLQLDGHLPIAGEAVGVSGGAHLSDDKYHFGGGGVHSSAAVVLRVKPAAGLEILPFWSGFRHHGMDTMPIVVPAGDFLPPRLQRGRFINLPWADYKGRDSNYGTIVRWGSRATEIAAGAFRSVTMTSQSFSELFTGVDRDGLADHHLISAARPQKFASTSGELRASHRISEGPRLHTVIVSARTRNRTRRYGGAALVDLGPTQVDSEHADAMPEVTFGEYTRDKVVQLSIGFGYEGRWKDVGELTLGLQKVAYRKQVRRPDQADPDTLASPWLFNAGAAIPLSPRLAAYASYTRGLEDSAAAPTYAVNREEAPPAILTMQYDGGLRWSVTPEVKLIAGLFNVEKPYFSTDSQLRYRRLGEVRHRGAELSLVGKLGPRLNLVAGAILLDARVSGEEVASGRVGKRPVGSVPVNLLLSADYRLPWVEGLSVDVSVQRQGERPANSANSHFLTAFGTIGAGVRYATKVAGRPISFRLQGSNLFDDYYWSLLGSNAYFYAPGRQIGLRMAADL